LSNPTASIDYLHNEKSKSNNILQAEIQTPGAGINFTLANYFMQIVSFVFL